eukprot:g1133.t1
MTVISGGGSFYSFYIETCQYQTPHYRHLLVNESATGLFFYHVNPEHAAGEAEMEIANSRTVRLFGLKSERNFCLCWIRNSSDILLTGFGGTATAFPLNHTWQPSSPAYQPGYTEFTPSLFRVEHSNDITLANLWGDGRVSGGADTEFCGSGTDPREWSLVLWTDLDTDRGNRSKGIGNTTRPLDRPVMFKILKRPSTRPYCFDLVRDCGAATDATTDVTPAFAKCQAFAASHTGCIAIPAGHFRCIAVALNTSNIAWQISNEAVFSPPDGMTRSLSMFLVGAQNHSDLSRVTNVSIIGQFPGKFTVDISKPQVDPWNVRAFQFVGGISHFLFANAFIKMANPATDPFIKIEGAKAGLEFNAVPVSNSTALNPKDGVIVNVTSTGSIYGYGTTQVQGLLDSHFENIDGTGGITLRLETGVYLPGKTVANITARNITCRDGHSAVMSGPHNQVNGRFEVQQVLALGCQSAVGIEAGFGDNGPPGTFSNSSSVANVRAVYGTKAQTFKNLTGASCTVCDTGEVTEPNYQDSTRPANPGPLVRAYDGLGTAQPIVFGYQAEASAGACDLIKSVADELAPRYAGLYLLESVEAAVGIATDRPNLKEAQQQQIVRLEEKIEKAAMLQQIRELQKDLAHLSS